MGTRGPRWRSLSAGVVAFLVLAQLWPSPTQAQWASDVFQLLLAVFAGWACVRAAQAGQAYARTFWLLIATGVFEWAAGQLFWMFNGEAFLSPSLPTLSEFFFLFAALPVILACGVRPDRAQPGGPRLALDLALIALVACFLYGYFVLAPFMGGDIIGYRQWFRHLADLNALLVLLAAVWLSRSSEPPWRSLYDRLAVSLGALFVGGRIADHAQIAGLYRAGLFDLAWTLPFVALGVSALEWAQSPLARQPRREPAAPDWRGIRRGTVLTAAAMVAIPTFHWLMAFVGEPNPDLRRWRNLVTVLTLAASAVIFLVRQLHLLRGVEDAQTRREHEIRKSEERFEKAFQASPAAMSISALVDGRYLDVNARFEEITGRSRADIVGKSALELGFWADPGTRGEMVAAMEGAGYLRHWPFGLRHSSGEAREAVGSFERIEVAGEPCVLAITEDVTERRDLEERLRQAEKLEAIGRLAGGIAHDFNNLLGVVLGYSELLQRRLADDPRSQKQLEAIRRAGERAAELTRQLLAYSRQQVLFPQVLDLGSVVEEVRVMLERLLGRQITLHTRVEPAIGSVRADRGQILHVLVNLALNARDGMPGGGTIRLECRNEPDPSGTSLGHVTLRVQDEGQGLDAAARAQVFEPFFGPKSGQAEVAGLGLASVYGIVKQSGGEILVESEPGRGSVFVVRLPRVPPAETAAPEPSPANGARGRTILLVDDQEMVREMTRSVLDEGGYQVLVAGDGEEALRVSEGFAGAIDLLITDVVMPGLSGPDTADRVLAARPETRVIFVSGYTADALGDRSALGPRTRFLQKPFKPDDLTAVVQAVLGGG
jgi:two-component system, cell cycle sensor histidine kinase and response regulator CckA